MKYITVGLIYLTILTWGHLYNYNKEKGIEESIDESFRRIRFDNTNIMSDDLNPSQVFFTLYEFHVLSSANEIKADVLYDLDVIDDITLACGVTLSLVKEIPEYAHLDIQQWIEDNLHIDLNQPQLNAIDAVTDALLEENEHILDKITSWLTNLDSMQVTQEAIGRAKITIEQEIQIVEVFLDRVTNDPSSYVRSIAENGLKNIIPKEYWIGYESGEVTLEKVVKRYIEDLRMKYGL